MKEVTSILVVIIVLMTGINYYIKNKDVTIVKSSIDNRENRIKDDLEELVDVILILFIIFFTFKKI